MSANNFTVRPGDIFRDRDVRMSGRHVKVISSDSRHVYVINCAADGGQSTGRKTRISLSGLETRFEKVGGSTQVADLERAVLSAAENWWVKCRPVGWDEDAHLASPAVNTTTDAAVALAEAVAALRRARAAKGEGE
jgi:hypothetical protein